MLFESDPVPLVMIIPFTVPAPLDVSGLGGIAGDVEGGVTSPLLEADALAVRSLGALDDTGQPACDFHLL